MVGYGTTEKGEDYWLVYDLTQHTDNFMVLTSDSFNLVRTVGEKTGAKMAM